MKIFVILAALMMSLSAFGYENKEYHCRNANSDLPDNVYRLSDSGVQGLPYLEVTRYYLDSNDVQQEVSIRGIPSVAHNGSSELLSLNKLYLEFVDSELIGCKN